MVPPRRLSAAVPWMWMPHAFSKGFVVLLDFQQLSIINIALMLKMTFNIVLRTIHFSTRLLQNVLANKSVNFCKGSLSVILFSVSVFHASCIYNTSSIAVYRLQA